MSRLFISHSSHNDDWAIALRDWLVREGWSDENDIFLDLDPARGIVAGERWAQALEEAATRCEAVLFLVSTAWLASKWCADEYQLANRLNKKLFALLIDDVPLERLPGGLTAQWQVVRLYGEPAERFLTVHPRTQAPSPVHIAKSGLASLKRGLEKAGIGAETFELQQDQNGPFGWRSVYRGLEALEPQDAAVFFGRNADMVRGIDALRGLAARKPPRVLVILGASGAGKSSFLRAGLWPRLARDDSQWLPLKAIRASRGGAIEGSEGLLASLEDVHARFGLRTTRATLRDALATPERFIALLRELRLAAARRTHLDQPPWPLPVLCLDQGEELFAAAAGPESAKLLALARTATDADAALLLVTIRSDAYGLMQGAQALADVHQVTLSLGPVPQGEISRIIREPSEVLRRKAGPQAPAFDPAAVEQLQKEITGEADALPLLAFVLQRLMSEYAGQAVIGLKELERTGGVAAAIEREAEAALADAGYGQDHAGQREVLRRLFIPRLARIERDSKAPQRRVAFQRDLPADLAPLARALTQRRLLVARVADAAESRATDAATLEVAHEAMLRRWPTLAGLLAEDRNALLLLDGVLTAASDWGKVDAAHKQDFLAHHGSRLADALVLATRGPDWAREIAPGQAYLAACQEREKAERAERETALARERAQLEIAAAQARTARVQRQGRWALTVLAVVVVSGLGFGVWQYRNNLRTRADLVAEKAEAARLRTQLEQGQVGLYSALSTSQSLQKSFDSALRLSMHAVQLARHLSKESTAGALSHAALAAAVWLSKWSLLMAEHGPYVRSAAFSPDGARIVTVSPDRSARVWNAVTGKEIAVLRGHQDDVWSAVFSPKGARIVTASSDGTARVWEAASGKEIAVLRGHEKGVHSAAFSPNGARIVTASSDGTARVWDAITGKEIAVFRRHGGLVASAAFSPGGARIVTASTDQTARVWEAASGKEIAVLRGHGSDVRSAAFSPDGARIVTASSDGTARVWEAVSGNEIVVLPGHKDIVWSAVFSPDGARIVTASTDRTARVWDAASGKEIAALSKHREVIWSAVFSPDGARIVTASSDRTARVWDAASGKEIAALLGHSDDVRFAAFSPDGARIVTASSDGTARVWEAAVGSNIAVVRRNEDVVVSAVFSPGGARIVTASPDGIARVWEAANGKEIAVLSGHSSDVRSAVFSPGGARIVTASSDGTARVWEAASGKEVAVLRGHEKGVQSATFSPKGARIVTASLDRTARVWEVASGREIAVLRGHDTGVQSAAFSPDGARIVTASSDGTARVWDAASGGEIAVLRGHEADVQSAVFSHKGARIVTASLDRTARVWDAASGSEIAVLRGHTDGLWSAGFSPDGARIVTASSDGTARVWDATAGKEIAVLHEDENNMLSAVFSPDGTRVITLSADKTAHIWNVDAATMPVARLIEEVCQRRLHGLTTLTRDEMRLAGYFDDMAPIGVCTAAH